MKRIINRCRYWGQLFLMPIYWLSFLIPRSKTVWVFGSTFGRRFADNPKYFFLYLSQHKEEYGVRPVWISRDKTIVERLRGGGYEAYYYHSATGIWLALRAKVYLFDNYSKDINFWQSGGAIKINLWHGIPLKKIQADNAFDKIRHPKNLWEAWKAMPRRLSDEKPSHYVLTTSRQLKPIFSSAFRTEHVLCSGYPRIDFLVSEEIANLGTQEEEEAVCAIEEFCGEFADAKVIYYMPTFRESEVRFFEVVALSEFCQFLEDNHLLFCVKLHPKSKLNAEFKRIAGKQILVVGKEADPYIILKRADVLVTDYSSIYFDYLATGKPIVYFNYDLEEYLRDSREMYFTYTEFTPGEKADTMEKLQQAVLAAARDEAAYQERYRQQREKVRNFVLEEKEELSCRALSREIFGIID